MSQEEKELLLKVLCAMFPYGVKIQYWKNETFLGIGDLEYVERDYVKLINVDKERYIGAIKPYLRPMSNMTEEEWEQLRLLKNALVECDESNDEKFYGIINDIHCFYYSHHIDCCGLIPNGLAFEAPKDMY